MNNGIFHLTIKDNETGEILRDEDVNCLIGGIILEDDSTGVLLARCNELELAEAVIAAETAVKSIKKRKGFKFCRLVKQLARCSETVEFDHSEDDYYLDH